MTPVSLDALKVSKFVSPERLLAGDWKSNLFVKEFPVILMRVEWNPIGNYLGGMIAYMYMNSGTGA